MKTVIAFYKVRIYFITLDEKSGAEKRTLARMLVQASSLKDAISIFEESMKKHWLITDL